MSWRMYPLAGGLGEWASRWDELNQSLYGGHPLFDSRFTSALLRHFGRGHECLAVHHDGDRWNGMLILSPYRKGWYITFRPSQAQVCPVLVEHADLLHTIFRDLGIGIQALDLLCQDPVYTPFASLNRVDSALIATMSHAVTMNVRLSGGFDSYWDTRPRNLRRNMRRYQNRIEREATTEQLSQTDRIDEMGKALARYSELEQAGWKKEAGTAIEIDGPQGYFYAEVLREFAKTDQAAVYEHVVDDKVIASRLLVWNVDQIIVLKTAYHEAFAKFAPGRRLLYLILEREFELSAGKSLEFYTNATVDQLSWATDTREIRHVTVYRNRAVRLGHQGLELGKRAVAALRRAGS